MIKFKSLLFTYSFAILILSILIHKDLGDTNSRHPAQRQGVELKGQLKYYYSPRGRINYLSNVGNLNGLSQGDSRSDKPVHVFIPGFTSTMKTFIPLLTGLDIEYVLLDFLGHGASDVPNDGIVSIPSMSSDLTSLLNHIFNSSIPSITLIGHSQGGSLATHFTLANSFVKRLVLLTPGGVDFRPKDFYDNLLHLPVRAIHDLGVYPHTQRLAVAGSVNTVKLANFFYKIDFIRKLFKAAVFPLFSNQKLFNDYCLLLEDWIYHFERLTRNDTYVDLVMSMMNNLDLLRDRTSLYAELGRVHLFPRIGIHRSRVKVDLVLGDDDAVVTIQQGLRLADKIEKVNLHVLPGGHLLPLEQPKEIAKILMQ